jgi:hypothetical protein
VGNNTDGGTTLAFNPNDFLPSPSGWFSTTIEYEGWGRAEFADPQGSVEGPTRLSFDDLGNASIEMRPDLRTLQTDRPLRFGLVELLSGVKPQEHEGTASLVVNLASQNPCTGLEVETPQGKFSSSDVSYHGRSEVWGDNEEVIQRITFEVFVSRFDSDTYQEPKYWVLPLTNFVHKFRPVSAEFGQHPLRIFPTPVVPDEITYIPLGPGEEEAKMRAYMALQAAYSKHHLIVYEFNGAPGFIEGLPGYEDRKEGLLANKERTQMTAVMVGEVGLNPAGTLDQVEPWLRPHDLLMLLTLATGTEVGAPWMELRDDEGRLVRRFHRRLREARFSRGHRVIEELPLKDGEGRNTGTGHLITRATSESKELGQSALRTAILHLVQSKYRDQSLDESLAHLCRGLDGLCERYGYARQNLMEGLNADQQEAVKKVRAEAFKKIRDINEAAVFAGDHSASAALTTIEGNVSNIANIERNFGLALTDLIEQFGLPDADILDRHYKANPRTDGKKHWAHVISRYRTDVIHHGYLRLGASGEGWREALAVINHLHDIMARIVLQALEYDGGYQPTMVPGPAVPFDLDWVKSKTTAAALGYQQDPSA